MDTSEARAHLKATLGYTDEQLDAMLAKLKDQLSRPVASLDKPKLTKPTVAAQRCYFLVSDGYFECVVPSNEAATPELAFEAAQSSLQPWYFVGHKGELAGHVTTLNYNQWVDWLRR